MPFTKKTWEDRLVEFAGRRKLTDVTTQAVQTVDVTRDEGNVSREGTAFSASNMNDLEQRIADCVSAMETTFQAGVDTLYNKCVSRGATPSGKTPTAIAGAIDTIYNNRYSEGYNAGYNAGLSAAPFKGYSFSNTIPASSAAAAYVQYPLTGVRTVTISGSCVNQYVNGYININGERVWTRDSAYADQSIPTITRTIDPNGTGTVEVGISAINGNATGINFSISAQI